MRGHFESESVDFLGFSSLHILCFMSGRMVVEEEKASFDESLNPTEWR